MFLSIKITSRNNQLHVTDTISSTNATSQKAIHWTTIIILSPNRYRLAWVQVTLYLCWKLMGGNVAQSPNGEPSV